MLTIHLLVDEHTIATELAKCLDSISGIPCSNRLVIGDLGADVETLNICKQYDARIVPAEVGAGMDECRNRVLGKTGWVLMLEPWEVLASGHDFIANRGSGAATFAVVHGGDVISKQVRLWEGGRFVNPVFERADAEGQPSPCMVLAGKSKPPDRKLADDWVARAMTSAEPYYYRSCLRLEAGDIAGFEGDAAEYLFRESDQSAVSAVMTRYYLASVRCYACSDATGAIRHLSPCLLARPTMAEFWCLLGDIYYHIGSDYRKAMGLYEDAIVLGSRRDLGDSYPVEMSKYGDHPRRMIASCERLLRARPAR